MFRLLRRLWKITAKDGCATIMADADSMERQGNDAALLFICSA
jgi:hypothetical protein